MSRISKIKRQLIEQANKRLLHESVHHYESPLEDKPPINTVGSIPPIFISDVDKALHTVYKSSQEDDVLAERDWLLELGYTLDEIEKEGEKIEGYIREKIIEAGEEGGIPNPFGPDAVDIKVVVPVTAEEPLTNR